MDIGGSDRIIRATAVSESHESLQGTLTAGLGRERVAGDGALNIFSRRTERRRRKHQIRQPGKPLGDVTSILHLPYELLVGVFSFLRPSDLVALSRACRPLRAFVLEQEAVLANNIVHWRYRCLEKCLRLPTLLQDVDESLRPLLQRDERQEIMAIHRKPYQHVSPSDPSLVCTCLTCILRWNSLCLVVDFGHWQSHLDRGEPIPMIPRGTHPEWNQRLIAANAAIVSRALRQPIWYACILQMHLWSTVTAIRRHSENKGNKRWRFLMTKADEDTETDAFLEREGPPTLDFPFHRDNYYMLEAFLPNRGWNNEQQRWMYLPAEQHDKDLQYIRTWARARYPAAMNVTDDVL